MEFFLSITVERYFNVLWDIQLHLYYKKSRERISYKVTYGNVRFSDALSILTVLITVKSRSLFLKLFVFVLLGFKIFTIHRRVPTVPLT